MQNQGRQEKSVRRAAGTHGNAETAKKKRGTPEGGIQWEQIKKRPEGKVHSSTKERG